MTDPNDTTADPETIETGDTSADGAATTETTDAPAAADEAKGGDESET